MDFYLVLALVACARVVGGVLVVPLHCLVCRLGFSLVGLHVGLLEGSGLFLVVFEFGCRLLLLRGGKSFAIFQVLCVSG